MEEDPPTRIDIDSLYERKRTHSMNELSTFKKVLARAHSRIKAISRQRQAEEYCWFEVPQHIIGVPRYDLERCVAWMISQLNANGFKTRYTHPCLLLISWAHWVPGYVRHQIKTKTGVDLDSHGNPRAEEKKEINPPSILKKPKVSFRDVKDYKPTGIL